ncbi:hypothetical protein B7R22_17225 [Subtercola boreus]|uniref:Minor tail protein n=1 Tax=Subtercola boreus TaxID=120213 RepID=A0A3E0VRI0_9MICO|nr:hypothetical protein [Subtercola boreus]RFA12170.1 hypothetical protein B7R22_17225 [Subtercola boreus]
MLLWTYWIVDTRTGQRVLQVTPSGCSWSRQLNIKASGSAVFDLADADNAALGFRSLTRKWARTLVVCWNEQIVYTGIITKSTYTWSSRRLVVEYSDFRAIIARRTTLGENGYTNTEEGSHAPIGSEDPANRYSLSTIIAYELRLLLEGPTSNYGLPFNRPSYNLAVHDGDAWRDYFDYNLPWLNIVVDELTNAENGPDVDYPGSWDANERLQWDARIGTPGQPNLAGTTWWWDLDAEEPGLFDLVIVEDAINQTNAVTVAGAGAELKRRYAVAREDSDLPALERMISYGTEDQVEALQSHANAHLAAYRLPTEEWSFWISADGTPSVGQLTLGDTLAIWSSGDPYIPDGLHQLRLVRFSGDMSTQIEITVQRIGGLEDGSD